VVERGSAPVMGSRSERIRKKMEDLRICSRLLAKLKKIRCDERLAAPHTARALE
jgi:hypothetical protein